MNFVRVILLIASLPCVSASAIDYDHLEESAKSKVTEDAYSVLWVNHPNIDSQTIDANSPYWSEFMKLCNKYTKEEFSDGSDPTPAPTESSGTSSGKPAFANSTDASSAASDTHGVINIHDNIITGAGSVAPLQTWISSFEYDFDNSNGKYMKAIYTFQSDDPESLVEFGVKGELIYDYGPGHGTKGPVIIYKPGTFVVSVKNSSGGIFKPVTHTFNFQIEFMEPTLANQAKALIKKQAQPGSMAQDMNMLQANLDAISVEAIAGSHSNGRKVVSTPAAQQPVQNPFHPNTPGGTATQPTSVAMPGYGQSGSSGQSSNLVPYRIGNGNAIGYRPETSP